MARPKIKMTLIETKEDGVCHHKHKIGDVFDFDTDRGKMCPMLLHTAFPFIDILRYGGRIPGEASPDECILCCPDARVVNVFKVEKVEE